MTEETPSIPIRVPENEPEPHGIDDLIGIALPEGFQPEGLHTKPSKDPDAAAHGAKQFQARFADAEVLQELDRTAKPKATWCVSVHSVDPNDAGDDGRALIRHWTKHHDRFPVADLPKCAAAFAELVARTVPLEMVSECLTLVQERVRAVYASRRRAADVGMMDGANQAPGTMEDEGD